MSSRRRRSSRNATRLVVTKKALAQLPGLFYLAGAGNPSNQASCRRNRRLSNGEQVDRLTGLALQAKPSVDFSGYWQRHVVD
jgi:hypothetical protein